jgi:hypothetical protein
MSLYCNCGKGSGKGSESKCGHWSKCPLFQCKDCASPAAKGMLVCDKHRSLTCMECPNPIKKGELVCEDHYNKILKWTILNIQKSVIKQLKQHGYTILERERLRDNETALKVWQAEQKAKETLLKEQAAKKETLLKEQAADQLIRNQLLKNERAGQKLPKKGAKPLDQTFCALKALRISNYMRT